MTRPLVSVIMPVYNSDKYLQRTIDSILSQTYRNFELIIIDDGSTDKSPRIIKAMKDSRVKLIAQKNKGVSASRNRGIRMAKGTFIAMHDGDDISDPARFQKQIDFLHRHPEVGLLGTNLRLINESGTLIGASDLLTNPDDLKLAEIFSNQIAQGSVMIRRDVLMQTELYDTSMSHAEDTDLWRRVSHLTDIANIKEPLYEYRIHSEGASSNTQKIRSSAMATAKREFSYYLGHKNEYKFLTSHPGSMLGGLRVYLARKSHMYRCMAWMYAHEKMRFQALCSMLVASLHAPWVAKNYRQLAIYLLSRAPTKKIEYEFF